MFGSVATPRLPHSLLTLGEYIPRFWCCICGSSILSYCWAHFFEVARDRRFETYNNIVNLNCSWLDRRNVAERAPTTLKRNLCVPDFCNDNLDLEGHYSRGTCLHSEIA